MSEFLFWIYLTNLVFLISHQIDSAYWKEWEMFGLSGTRGVVVNFFFNLVAISIFMYGLIPVFQGSSAGLAFSLALSVVGLLTFLIHLFFFGKGRNEFKTSLSFFILTSVLIISVLQSIITIALL